MLIARSHEIPSRRRKARERSPRSDRPIAPAKATRARPRTSAAFARTFDATLRSFFKHVPATTNGDDVARIIRIDFDFLAQPTNMHADRLLLSLEIISPNFIEQRLARDDASAIFHEHLQKRIR